MIQMVSGIVHMALGSIGPAVQVPTAVVVDDFPVMRELLREFLKRCGLEVVGEAGTAQELLQGYPQWRPDLVVLDVLLPDGNGIEVTKNLIATDPKAKILVISGLEGDLKMTGDCMAAGAKAFLPKPFSSEDFVRTIESMMKA